MINEYMDFAKTHDYDIEYVGIGMAYLTIHGKKLTETKDVNVIRKELTLIGLAILADTLRAMDPSDFSEHVGTEDDE